MDASRPALRRALVVGAAAVPAAFAALFFALPFAAILERGLRQDGRLSFPATCCSRARRPSCVWFTTWQAAASTALTMALGLPLAWVVGRFKFRGHGLVRALVLVPFVLPTVVVATAFLALLPERLQHGVWPILAAHAFFNIAVVTRVVGGTWAGLDRAAWEVASTLGAGPVRRLREITLPLLAPALSAAAALTFLFCFTSFGVVLILGGPTRSTLETAIYDQAARAFDLRAAAALSLLQLVAVGLVLTIASRLESRIDGVRDLADEQHARRRPIGPRAARGLGDPRRGGNGAGAAARRARPALPRCLARSLRGDAGIARHAVARGGQLARLRLRSQRRSRWSSEGSPPSRSRGWPREPPTRSCCSRSAPRPSCSASAS